MTGQDLGLSAFGSSRSPWCIHNPGTVFRQSLEMGIRRAQLYALKTGPHREVMPNSPCILLDPSTYISAINLVKGNKTVSSSAGT